MKENAAAKEKKLYDITFKGKKKIRNIENEIELSRILEVRRANRKREFLIHWNRCSPKLDTWMPETTFYWPDLIKEFTRKLHNARLNGVYSLRLAPKKTHRFSFEEPCYKNHKLRKYVKKASKNKNGQFKSAAKGTKGVPFKK